MNFEFISYIDGHNSSETHPGSGPVLQPNYLETIARTHEETGVDRTLIAFHSNSPGTER
jgi:alkanesulfonate monooxygenase